MNLQNIIRMQYLTGVNGNKNIPNENEMNANQITVAYTQMNAKISVVFPSSRYIFFCGSINRFILTHTNTNSIFSNRSAFKRWNWNINSREIQSNRQKGLFTCINCNVGERPWWDRILFWYWNWYAIKQREIGWIYFIGFEISCVQISFECCLSQFLLF